MRTDPTVGRKLYYYPGYSDIYDANKPMHVYEQPLDATVVYVHSSTLINLVILDAEGGQFIRTSVRLIQEDDEEPDGSFAKWMPYQVAYASKEAKKEASKEVHKD